MSKKMTLLKKSVEFIKSHFCEGEDCCNCSEFDCPVQEIEEYIENEYGEDCE